MNKAYRTIWSSARGTWMAVPEAAKGGTRCKVTRKGVALAVHLLMLAGAGAVHAQSVGSGQTGAGTGTAISSTGCATPASTTAAVANAVAIGCGATAGEGTQPGTGPGSTPLVPYSNIAIGTNAQAPTVPLRGSNIAIGALAQATGDGVNGGDQIAIGNVAIAFGADSIALGTQTNASGLRSIVIGGNFSEVDAASANAIVIGVESKATGAPNSIVMGTQSFATAANAVVLGANSKVSGLGGVALGTGSSVTNPNSVAIGTGSQANSAQVPVSGGTINNTPVTYAGTAPTGTVSLGTPGAERQLTNVAAGQVTASSTDGINGSQLFAAQQAIDNLGTRAVQYDLNVDQSVNYGSVTLGQPGVPNTTTVIHNVAPGVLPTDAANVSQLNTASNKWIVGNPGVYAPPLASGKNATAVGSGATSSGDNSVALGDGSSDGGRANVVAVGSAAQQRQLTQVAAGTQTTDAVNLGQLTPFATALGGGTAVNSDGSVTGPTYNITTIGSGGSKNSSSYNNVGDALGGLSTSVVNLNDAVSNFQQGKGIRYFHANSSQADSSAGGAESTALGPQAVATGESAIAAGDRSSAGGSGSVAVGQQSAATGASSIAIGQSAQASNAGSIALGLNTVSGGLNTVAIGTGAVATNSVAVGAGAQAGGGSAAFGDNANALNASLGTALGNGATVTAAAPGGVALGSAALADRAGLAGQREAVSGVVVNSTQGAVSVGSAGAERQITHVAGGTQPTDAVNLRQLQASQSGGVRYDTQPDGTTNYNQVTLGNGQAAGGTTVSNVAPATAGTDAVNLNQLNAGLAGAQQYADRRFDEAQGRLDGVAKDASAAAAGAMAMANLPQASLPGKSMISAGVAGYDGQAALAIGVSKLSDNARWIVKFSGTANSRGKVGVAAGVGFHW